jgi:hypothetical protein
VTDKTSDEQTLRLKARKVIEMGELPCSQPHQMWGGKGNGERCVLCLAPVESNEIGFELEFAASQSVKHIHQRCFSVWDSERRTVQSSQGAHEFRGDRRLAFD